MLPSPAPTSRSAGRFPGRTRPRSLAQSAGGSGPQRAEALDAPRRCPARPAPAPPKRPPQVEPAGQPRKPGRGECGPTGKGRRPRPGRGRAASLPPSGAGPTGGSDPAPPSLPPPAPAPALTELPPAACAPARFPGMAPASGFGGGSALMPRSCPRRLGALRDDGDAAEAAEGPAPSWAPRPSAACRSGCGASGDAERCEDGRGWTPGGGERSAAGGPPVAAASGLSGPTGGPEAKAAPPRSTSSRPGRRPRPGLRSRLRLGQRKPPGAPPTSGPAPTSRQPWHGAWRRAGTTSSPAVPVPFSVS